MIVSNKSYITGTIQNNTNNSPAKLTKKAERNNIYKLDENIKFNIIEFVKRTNEYESQNLKIELSDGRIGYLIHPYGVFYIFD